MEFFTLITIACEKVYCIQLFGVNNLAIFSMDKKSTLNLTFYDTLIEFLQNKFVCFYLHFLVTLKPNAHKRATKIKHIYYKCVLELLYASNSERLHSVKKKFVAP
jgi:hypothetical protein